MATRIRLQRHGRNRVCILQHCYRCRKYHHVMVSLLKKLLFTTPTPIQP